MSTHASASNTPHFRIFLSHAGEEKETIARPLFKRLNKHGLSVFLDEESFRLGDDCPDVILHAMETAAVGVFIMTPEFVAKEWPMRELLAFVRRFDHAKKNKETPPTLIPVFYRFSTGECRDQDIFNTYGELFTKHGLFERACTEVVSLKDVMHALDTAAKVWSIRNDVGATTSNKPHMLRTRETLLGIMESAILEELGIDIIESSDKVHPSTHTSHTQPPQPEEYTSRNLVPPNPLRLTLNYDALPTCEGRLRAAVLRKSDSRVVAVLATGKGGVGKTCALRGLGEDSEIRQVFDGGILWMELGHDASLQSVIGGMADIVKRTGGVTLAKLIATMKSVGEASQEASKWFGERRCLFLVDDIWNVNGIDSNVLNKLGRVVGAKSRVVYTTRDRYFVHDSTELIEFKEMETHGELSRLMLMTHAGFGTGAKLEDKNEEAVKYFLRLCQGLPLGFGIIGQSVREYSLDCSPREDGWSEFQSAVEWRQEDLMKTKAKSYGPIGMIVDSSVLVLEKRNRHGKYRYWFRALSVLQKQQSVPVEMLQKLWKLETMEETRAVVKSLADVSVVEMVRKRGSMFVKLHDLILDVAIHQARGENETESWFRTLVDNYMACGDGKLRENEQEGNMTAAERELCCAWWKVEDDGYIRDNVCRLLRNAGYGKQLLWVLSQPEWIVRRLVEDGILKLEQDLEHGREVCHVSTSQHKHHEEHLRMIGRAARMSAVYVNKNARVEEGWFQVHGRFLWHATQNELTKEFVERMEECAPRPWLQASVGLLQQAGSNAQVVNVSREVVCTHEDGDAIWILSAGLSVMVVGSYDTRNEIYKETELEMYEWSYPECASFLGDHRRVVTAHSNGHIGVWNTETGECEKVVAGSSPRDSLYLLVALRRLVDTLVGDKGEPRRFVEFLELGSLVACTLRNHSIEIRDTVSGEAVCPPLRGHTEEVRCVGVSTDGTRIVSGSDDKSVRVWDAQSGSAVGEPLQGHTDGVICVGVSADGTRIVSGSDDKSIRVWDLQSKSAVGKSLRGHTDWVRCVTVSAEELALCQAHGTKLFEFGTHRVGALWGSRSKVTRMK